MVVWARIGLTSVDARSFKMIAIRFIFLRFVSSSLKSFSVSMRMLEREGNEIRNAVNSEFFKSNNHYLRRFQTIPVLL